MTIGIRRAALAAAALAALGFAVQARARDAAPDIGLSVNPGAVCLDTRPADHLNFDLVIRNGTARALKVREMRAVVLDGKDEVAWSTTPTTSCPTTAANPTI